MRLNGQVGKCEVGRVGTRWRGGVGVGTRPRPGGGGDDTAWGEMKGTVGQGDDVDKGRAGWWVGVKAAMDALAGGVPGGGEGSQKKIGSEGRI